MLWIKGKKRRGGFTLIEIMIVVLIIAILLAIAIPNFLRARESSRAKSCQGNLRQIETAKEQWAMDNKKAGSDKPDDTDLAPTYMKAYPACPSAGTYANNDMTLRPTCTKAADSAKGNYDYHGLD